MDMRNGDQSDYDFAGYSANYYGKSNGVMLETFPAMDEVLNRLTHLPPNEQVAWGQFLMVVSKRLMKIGHGHG